MMAASLLDDTDEPSMTAIMFSRDRTSFPKLGCVGDVLCLHRVLPQVRTFAIFIIGGSFTFKQLCSIELKMSMRILFFFG